MNPEQLILEADKQKTLFGKHFQLIASSVFASALIFLSVLVFFGAVFPNQAFVNFLKSGSIAVLLPILGVAAVLAFFGYRYYFKRLKRIALKEQLECMLRNAKNDVTEIAMEMGASENDQKKLFQIAEKMKALMVAIKQIENELSPREMYLFAG